MTTTTTTEATFSNGAIRVAAGAYLAAAGVAEIVTATYNVVKTSVVPVAVCAGSTVYNATNTYVIPSIVSAVTRIVKGKPQAAACEAFDAREELVDDEFTGDNNGSEL